MGYHGAQQEIDRKQVEGDPVFPIVVDKVRHHTDAVGNGDLLESTEVELLYIKIPAAVLAVQLQAAEKEEAGHCKDKNFVHSENQNMRYAEWK